MYFIDRYAVAVRPTQKFLDWLNAVGQKQNPDYEDLALEEIRAVPTLYLVPEVSDPQEVIAYIDEKYADITAAELSSWYMDESLWPEELDLAAFWQLFEVEIFDEVVDLADTAEDGEDAQ